MNKNKISIEWNILLKDIVRNFWVVVLCALIGVMGNYLAGHINYEPLYTSSATLAVFASGNSGSYSTIAPANEKANVLVNVLTESTVKECAAEYLGVDGFDGSISATVLDNTNFIELKVTSDHPEKAYNLLNAVIKSHHKISDKVFKNAGLSVLKMPSVPTAPSNRISNSNNNLIIVGAATLSLAVIAVLSIMRNTVKKESDFNEKIDSKLIGTIAHENKQMTLQEIKQKKKKGLLIRSNAYISLRFTENFHKIAAKLEHMQSNEDCKVFAITSVAENEGKSTCAANIAVSLADRGNKVVLVDFDFKKPALYKIFDEEFSEGSELSELLEGKINENDYKFKSYKKTPLFLAFSTKPAPDYRSWISDGKLAALVEKLKSTFDYVIIDTAPISVDTTVSDIVRIADKTIMVIRTDTVTVNVLNDHIATLSKVGSNLAGCILNDVYMNILPFSITGNDESNYYGHKYGRYTHYGNYGHYGHYGKHHSHKKDASEDTVTAENKN